jgi:hypothetical protein
MKTALAVLEPKGATKRRALAKSAICARGSPRGIRATTVSAPIAAVALPRSRLLNRRRVASPRV